MPLGKGNVAAAGWAMAYVDSVTVHHHPSPRRHAPRRRQVAIWRSKVRYERERASVRTWVLGIVHHRTIDALRRNLVHERRRASAEGIEERLGARELTDVEAVRREEAREVRAALSTLPGEQSRVIELAYYGGFTHTQIAEMLDMPVGTVKGRMRLGLEKMRREMTGATA